MEIFHFPNCFYAHYLIKHFLFYELDLQESIKNKTKKKKKRKIKCVLKCGHSSSSLSGYSSTEIEEHSPAFENQCAFFGELQPFSYRIFPAVL